MCNPKVSVVLLAHNGSRFVAEAVESILSQTYQHIEVIIVDDGSTDGTSAIISRFRDRRIRVVRQPNLWIGFAHNRGVSVATGEYIAAMSHDDISLPHRLATQIEAMERDNLDVCFSWAEIIDGEGCPLKHPLADVFNQPGHNSQEILEKLKFGNFLLAPSAVRRRECYYHFAANVALFALQDYALWLRMLRRYRARVLEIPLVRYRVHDSNVSLVRFSDNYRAVEALAARRLAEDPPFPRSSGPRAALARELLATSRRMTQNPDSRVEAYIAANRAVNLDPTAPEGYHTLALLLSAMGYDEPAAVARSIGQRVDKSLAYPLPLLAPVAPARMSSMRGSVAQTPRVEDTASIPAPEGYQLSVLLRQFEEERDYLHALLRQSQEEGAHLQALLRQFENEQNSLQTQARLSEEERDRLQVALRLTETERDALSSHLRAVASGRILRLLNTLAGPHQKRS